jgi:2-oxoglutarate ferredoxin oxidoreductase subunit beta
MAEIFRRAAAHKGCSFVEVYQNCNIFNDGAYQLLTEQATKLDNVLYLEEGKPLIYGKEQNHGLRLNGFNIEKVDLGENAVADGLIYHAENSKTDVYAHLLAQITDNPDLPTPVGVFRAVERQTYDDMFHRQIDSVTQKKGKGDLKQLFLTGDTWKVE